VGHRRDHILRPERRVAAKEYFRMSGLEGNLVHHRHAPFVKFHADVPFDPWERILLADRDEYVIRRIKHLGLARRHQRPLPLLVVNGLDLFEHHADELVRNADALVRTERCLIAHTAHGCRTGIGICGGVAAIADGGVRVPLDDEGLRHVVVYDRYVLVHRVLFLPGRCLHFGKRRADYHLHVLSAQAARGSAAVHCGVAAAEHYHALADLRRMFERNARQPVDADVYVRGAFFAAGYLQLASARRSRAHEHRVVILFQHFLQGRNIVFEMRVDAQPQYVIDLFVQHALRQPECRYLRQHKAAALELFVEKVHLVAERRKVARHRQARRPRAYQRHLSSVRLKGALRHIGQRIFAKIGRHALKSAYGYGLFVYAPPAARRFARAVARAPQDPREDVRVPVDHVRLGVPALRDQADILRHRRVRRACPLAVHHLVEIFWIVDIRGFQADNFLCVQTIVQAQRNDIGYLQYPPINYSGFAPFRHTTFLMSTSRRDFLKAAALGAAGSAFMTTGSSGGAANEPAAELIEMTIADLQAGMKAGRFTARALAERYLERIREIDPRLRSVIETNPDALSIAAGLDAERRRGRVRSVMHGIPVLIKDNIDTADRMLTTAGSLALVDAPRPARDAFVVQRLRRAGAVILGKTNLSEWANFRSTRSVSGWSGRGGQTNNPYILDKNPCGSSSGSGVAVSANLAAAALGTETNGSIICPAVRSGIVGIKPTLGLVSRSGIIPIAHTQDTAGPMARTVADAVHLLDAMNGRDKLDAVTAAAPKGTYARYLDPNGLRGMRVGVAGGFVGNNAAQKANFEAGVAALRDAGAVLVDVTFPVDYGKLSDDRLQVLLYEFKADLNKYLAARGAKYRTLADLIKFNEDNKDREMPIFGQELFTQAEAKGPLSDAAYREALGRIKKATREDGIDAVARKDRLDAIAAPTVGATWSIAAVAGYPYITVPSGFSDGMPLGMAFFGPAFSEPKLIAAAYAFEQRTRARKPPQYLPKWP
jgi:amidase